ncbi:MAG: tetratricopeptide repeat protein [Candidatus Margulisbacteria bacterium]|jgi:tetratricopeptide (TPR) repeat protein|nr:tetratricopeptide repeat protein [Candidatus Margulisiibacteriota bacterium]
MKRIIAGLIVTLLVATGALALKGGIDRENLSLKAGPTQPGEALSLVWVESLIYPSVVRDERVVSLGVRTAAPVKAVNATFDFAAAPVNLTSHDGTVWSAAFKLPGKVAAGVHVARYQISGQRGSIQRSVEFFVENSGQGRTADISHGEVYKNAGWPLTVSASCTAFSLDANRHLRAGQVLTSIAKMTWYKVVFDDGKEGWVSAVNVKEPAEDFCLLGERAEKAGKFQVAEEYYQQALAIDAALVSAHVGLARSYLATGQNDAAAEAVKKALRLDDRDIEARVVANRLAESFMTTGRHKVRAGNWQAASGQFRQATELRPDSAGAWLELGNSLAAVGLNQAAKDAWVAGLKSAPLDRNLRAKLGGREIAIAEARAPLPTTTARVAKPAAVVSPLIANDSLQLLKNGKTNKGTRIEAALKSVVALTKSLGTPIAEKGWQVKKQGEKALVSYLCAQGGGALESFDWLVDVDTRQVLPHNDNARLLMSRW